MTIQEIQTILVGLLPALVLFFFKRWIGQLTSDMTNSVNNLKTEIDELKKQQNEVKDKLHKLEVDMIKNNKADLFDTEIKSLEKKLTDLHNHMIELEKIMLKRLKEKS